MRHPARGPDPAVSRRRLRAARTVPDPRSRPRDRAEILHRCRRVRGQPVRGRPDHRQAAPDQFRPRRSALDLQLGGLSADQAGAGRQRQDPDRRGPRRRRPGRQDFGLRRRPVDPDRHRARRWRRLRGQQHRAAPPEGYRRRRQGRPDPRDALGFRHRGHAPHPAHAAVGIRRGSTSTSRSISIVISRPPTASAGWAEAGSGNSAPRRCGWRSSPGDWSIPGAITSTAGGSRSRPTAPAARGSTTASPGPTTSGPWTRPASCRD